MDETQFVEAFRVFLILAVLTGLPLAPLVIAGLLKEKEARQDTAPGETMSARFKVQTVSILTAGTMAAGLSLEGFTPFALQMSTAITGTKISFQASQDETNYFNLFSSTGGEITLTVAASRYVLIPEPDRFLGIAAIKLRAGTSTGTSTQAAVPARSLIAAMPRKR